MHYTPLNHTHNRGFSLTEILVTVAIITILLAILLFPIVSQMRSAAIQAKCIGQLRGIAINALVMMQDNDGYIGTIPGGKGPGSFIWAGEMSKQMYNGSFGDFFSPHYDWVSTSETTWYWFISYAINNRADSGIRQTEIRTRADGLGYEYHRLYFSRVEYPANFPFFITLLDSTSPELRGRFQFTETDLSAGRFGIALTHNLRASVAFLDGRVEALSGNELKQLGFTAGLTLDRNRVDF